MFGRRGHFNRSHLVVLALLLVQTLLIASTMRSQPTLTSEQGKCGFTLRIGPGWRVATGWNRFARVRAFNEKLVGYCNVEQFDAIRNPMEFKEIVRLLGPPIGTRFDSLGMQWLSVDGRMLLVTGIDTLDENVEDIEVLLERRISFIKCMSMTRDFGLGYREHFGIPARKPDEVETAIGRLGPKGPPSLL